MSINPGQELIGGVVLANVASGVSAGTELGPSATDGELASGSDGYSAVTDEGDAAGLSTAESIPSGYAGVRVTGDGEITYEAGETVSPGDAVGIDGGQLRAANSGDGSPNAQFIAGHGGGATGGEDYASGDNVPVYNIE
jgi:hypothetical protein